MINRFGCRVDEVSSRQLSERATFGVDEISEKAAITHAYKCWIVKKYQFELLKGDLFE